MTNDVSLPLADKIAINSNRQHILYKDEEAVTLIFRVFINDIYTLSADFFRIY